MKFPDHEALQIEHQPHNVAGCSIVAWLASMGSAETCVAPVFQSVVHQRTAIETGELWTADWRGVGFNASYSIAAPTFDDLVAFMNDADALAEQGAAL